jgi:hypothetical protein
MPKKPAVVTGPHPDGGWQNEVEGNQRASNVAPTKGRGAGQGSAETIERQTEHRSRTRRVKSPD